MPGELEQPEPAQLRISDADRNRVAEMLREAAGEGRLDLDELDQRLEATYAAKTYGDLVPITLDLPAHPSTAAHAPVVRRETLPAAATYRSSVALMSETRRQGPWLVPEHSSAFSFMGSVVLDLREATFETPEVTITATAVMAGVEVIVDAQTQVVVDGFALMGEFTEAKSKVPHEVAPDAPVVRVKGFALMGSVSVIRKGPHTPSRRELRGGRP